MTWKIGDKIKHKNPNEADFLIKWGELDLQEDCERRGCINLSEIGRKAAAKTKDKVSRDLLGRFCKRGGIRDQAKVFIDENYPSKVFYSNTDFITTKVEKKRLEEIVSRCPNCNHTMLKYRSVKL